MESLPRGRVELAKCHLSSPGLELTVIGYCGTNDVTSSVACQVTVTDSAARADCKVKASLEWTVLEWLIA